ncbi:putative phage abortive infection protein [Thalassobius sp. I31.1]|uniref:putative phage abortive infection protein n=1 Tax=Thalassobius sp. I31.1 TaxID=2109912 RepID=UPI00130050A8|nr:putative phage abortive infection protein [Thalassobius sp. I31.1]
MIDFTRPCLTLPLISVTGVITSLAGIVVIEGIMKRENKDALKRWLLLSLPFVGVLALCVAWLYWGAFLLLKGQDASQLTEAGAAGDTFGGLTSLFSGLAFSALVVTLVFQRKELELQRGELEQTRNVFQRQKLESTYFHLLKLFRDYVENTSCQRSDFTYRRYEETDSDVLNGQALLRELAVECMPGKFPLEADLEKFECGKLQEFKDWYDEYGDFFLGPYFRLLWNCVRLVDDQKPEDLNDDEKLGFVQYLRATLSPAEIKLLAFYGLSEAGGKVGDEYIARYQLIKYLKIKDVERYPFLVQAYGPDAFGDRYDTVEDAMRRGVIRNTDREQ